MIVGSYVVESKHIRLYFKELEAIVDMLEPDEVLEEIETLKKNILSHEEYKIETKE